MAGKKILFIVRSYLHSAPQPLRFQKIISSLKNEYNIHVLMMHHGKRNETVNENYLTLHKIPYSRAGRLFTNQSKINNRDKENGHVKIKADVFKRIASKLEFRAVVLPDPLIFEYPALKKTLKKLLMQYNYDLIVGSSYPHTTLMLSAVAKKNNKSIKWVHDIGDPLYSPLNRYRLRAKFSYFFEKRYCNNVDKLIVTNQATKDYYIKRYKYYNEKNVIVIPQGADISSEKNVTDNKSRTLQMIYAGTFYDKVREPFKMYKAIESFKKIINLQLFGNIPLKHQPPENITNIQFMGPVPFNQILENYKKADIILYMDNAYGLQTPGKVFEVIATFKPILCIYENENSASLEYFKKVPFAFICKNQKEKIITTLNEMIIKIRENDISFDFDVSEFSWENRSKVFRKIIEELIR